MTTLPYRALPRGATLDPCPFRISIPDEEVLGLRTLLKLSKLPPPNYEGLQEDRRFGVTSKWIRESKKVWEEEFDWRKIETQLNSYPHYKVPITNSRGEMYNIHFVALFSENPNAQNIIFNHGWPGSFIEFLPILSLLVSKYTPATLPYNVLIPSLPGYTFSSSPPLNRDFDLEDVAELIDKLAVGLGMKGYVTQGGDIGSRVARILGMKEECLGVHLNCCTMLRPTIFPPSTDSDLNATEREHILRLEKFLTSEHSYAKLHATKPSTIGFVVGSNPVALLSWISEKFLAWSDEDMLLETILIECSLYWFTNCFSTTIYPYRHEKGPETDGHGASHLHLSKPLGYSSFPKEISNPPRKWIEMTASKILMWREHTKGGHFAALEEPEVLLKDIEDFMAML